MFEVIINTVSTGRVRRKAFASLGEAERCAEWWRARSGQSFVGRVRVELVRYEPVAPVSLSMNEATVRPVSGPVAA